jgi:membrane-bound serine protease (ClpP class)
VEIKAASAVSALIRANAEKHGHNVEVADAMVKKTKELKIDGKVLNEKGQILTLTAKEAEEKYGTPPKPLLSAGTVETLDKLLDLLGYKDAEVHRIEPTGMEKLGTWINAISPLLLIIGVIGIYIEFKTPGFGLPGIVGIVAFAVYFLGGYVAGLSGMEWMLVFILGLALVAIELFAFPGTIALGLLGVALMLASIIMALVDMYPGMPAVPTLPALRLPLENLVIAFVGSAVGVVILSRILPRTPMYRTLVSQTASGMATEQAVAEHRSSLQGQVGVAISTLRPGGKAQFGDQVLDVISQGDMVAKGRKVKIIGYSGREAVVTVAD